MTIEEMRTIDAVKTWKELEEAKERIKRLEEAGNNMAEWLAHSRNLGADPFLSETWNKAKQSKL